MRAPAADVYARRRWLVFLSLAWRRQASPFSQLNAECPLKIGLSHAGAIQLVRKGVVQMLHGSCYCRR